MLKVIENFVSVIFCLVVLEFSLYNRDYNELKFMTMYISYDVNLGNFQEFENDKYEVKISGTKEDNIEYEIVMKRNSLFNIKRLKTIKYIGLVS